MILKFKNPDGSWKYIDNLGEPIVKKNVTLHFTDVIVGNIVHHVVGEAYLLNDHGQTIERLN